MADDDPFPFGVGEDDGSGLDAEAEGSVRDMEAELLERSGSASGGLGDRVDQLEQTDAPREVAVPFWTAVIFADVGVLLVVLGPLLAYFRGLVVPGIAITLAGVYALYRTYATYQEFKQSDPSKSTAEADPDSASAVDGESADAAPTDAESDDAEFTDADTDADDAH